MTGKELIDYILENNLVDADIFKSDKLFKFIGIDCMPIAEACLKYNVGYETIHAWCTLGKLKSIRIEDKIYILSKKEKDDE